METTPTGDRPTVDELHARIAVLRLARIDAAVAGDTMRVLEIRAEIGKLSQEIRRRTLEAQTS